MSRFPTRFVTFVAATLLAAQLSVGCSSNDDFSMSGGYADTSSKFLQITDVELGSIPLRHASMGDRSMATSQQFESGSTVETQVRATFPDASEAEIFSANARLHVDIFIADRNSKDEPVIPGRDATHQSLAVAVSGREVVATGNVQIPTTTGTHLVVVNLLPPHEGFEMAVAEPVFQSFIQVP